MTLTIESRYCGPPRSGNGGYTCGLLAAYVGGTAEVTLRAPPPLDTPLRVERVDAGAKLWHGAQLIAEAHPALLDLEPPPAPSWDEAVAAAQAYAGLHAHAYPTCFTCGPQRAAGDGLRIFSGPLAEGPEGRVAAPWTPNAALANKLNEVREPFLWAALDCPGFWAGAGNSPVPTLLGRMTARFEAPVHAGVDCIVLAWTLGREGRKRHAGTAIYTRDGALVGASRQTWIEVARP